ncbi:hypothetical protein FHR32_006276 [Streptosporangium album]|uniref:DUF1963 domain-containing protein n=1 Tax=Streptosporangium album TaxID=47479 RepID=A0A7W7S0X2_9ACTN|nr:DUF1963 domain-containing protein [Streptosporangium album]MBB4941890.1 hypothetical protein [Streptosporangium album]
MEPRETLAALHDFCVERFGAELTPRIVSLARPGFDLRRAEPGEGSGHCRFGGRAMLEPGTPWPTCEDDPLSLFAVLDTDVLAPWLGDLAPAGTGLLNFFYLDDIGLAFEPEAVAVIAARSGHAVEIDPPAESKVFAPVAWKAESGFAMPDGYDAAWEEILDDVEYDTYEYISDYVRIGNTESDWLWARPGVLTSGEIAFGWPMLPGTVSQNFPDGEDPNSFHHLLQLSDQGEWHMEGEGGWMHWSIPTQALSHCQQPAFTLGDSCL